MQDFLKALDEVKPAFGAAVESLEAYRMQGIIDYGDAFSHLQSTLRALVSQVSVLLTSSTLPCLVLITVMSSVSALSESIPAELCGA